MRRSLLAVVVMAFVLTGCSHGAIILTPEEGDIPKCALGQDPIPVEKLDTNKKATCMLADVDLVFPDGTHLNVNEGAASGSRTDGPQGNETIYTFYSVGEFGFVAGVGKTGCRETHEWGSAEARVKVREAFGKDWPCPQ
jgi:hypothetical protein